MTETYVVKVRVALQNTPHECFLAGYDCAIQNKFALEAIANDDNVTVPDGDLIVPDERVLSEDRH
jgi:hypothetical protein